MQTELELPPLVERIYANVTYFSVKCLYSPHLAPHFSAVIRTSLDPDAPRLPLRPGSHNLINAVCDNLRGLDINVPRETAIPGLPPWRVPLPLVTFTPTSKDALPFLQKQLALDTIACVSTSVPAAHHIYVDGSVQADGSAACAIFSPTIEPVGGEWLGRRLPNSSSSTYCELHGILDAITLLVRRSVNGVIICDSQSALHSLSSPRPSCDRVVQDILHHLAFAHDASLVVSFVWTPSHIGLTGNDMVDRLAKAACALNTDDDDDTVPSLRCFRTNIYSAAYAMTVHRRDAERANSVSIQHHDHFLQSRHKYRRYGVMVRRHNVVSARLRLGYRPVWQVSQAEDVPHYSSCKLCNCPNANNLQHYCLECPTVRGLLPQGLSLTDTCAYLLTGDNLDKILLQFPYFGGC